MTRDDEADSDMQSCEDEDEDEQEDEEPEEPNPPLAPLAEVEYAMKAIWDMYSDGGSVFGWHDGEEYDFYFREFRAAFKRAKASLERLRKQAAEQG